MPCPIPGGTNGCGRAVMRMAKYECESCGWKGKPIFMEPATRLCPNCRSINVKKVKKDK